MPIRRAIGLGVGILVLKLLTPEIFANIEHIILLATHVFESNLAAVGAI
ncbi:MAG: hypothetical protein ACJKSS_02835 [Patescibacteria group bacterium UBA2103]